MKHILLLITALFSLSVSAQDHNDQWAKVAQLEMNGEIKPALVIVENIYAKVKKEKNEPQILKSFFFRAKYMQVLEEDAQVKIVKNLLDERETASVATRAIIESLYAELLNAIYNKNRVAINQRSYIDSLPDKDIMKWGGKNFKDEINAAYARSLKNRDLLYKIPLEDYEVIVDLNPVMRKTNRSLYDLLAERFLEKPEFETTYENRKLAEDQYPLLFGTTQEFLALQLPDTLGTDFKERLLLCRELERHYLEKNDAYGLHRSVLRRLNYADMKVKSTETNTLYLNTVSLLSSQWKDSPFAYRAKLVQVRLYKNEANKITHPDHLIRAMALCDDIIAHGDLSDAVTDARNIRNAILQKSLSIQTEKYIAPNRTVLAKLTFRNVDSLRLRIYKIKKYLPQNDDNYYGEYRGYTIDSLKHLKPFLEKTYVLPVKKDHFEYTTEIILPPLDKGTYALIMDPVGEKADPHAEETSTLAIIQASQLTMAEFSDHEGENYQFSDRDTGKPVEGVHAIVKNRELVSDKSGKIRSLYTGTNNRENIVFTKDGDTLTSYYYNYTGYSRDRDRVNSSVELYLDRAIYRPGQEVFFKGILLQQKNGMFSTVPNVYVKVLVEDDSLDEVAELLLKTNEFGSFTGKFILPKGVTGEFTISIEDEDEDEKGVEDKTSVAFWDTTNLDFRDYTFRVEEYKRPTFSVGFDPVKESIRVNTIATIKGSAKAFSGAPIGGANVKYRITRDMKQYSYYYEDDDDGEEINNGETTTDAQGNFNITFEAKPDDYHSPENKPVFTYAIYAEVTDINGETRTEKIKVFAGYHTTTLDVWAPGNIDTKKGGKIQLNSENLNGVFTPVEGEIRIYKMSAPEKLLVGRPWPVPELQAIGKEEFGSHFPYLPYTEEKDSILKSKVYFAKHINTSKTKEVALTDFKGWESGQYRIVFTAKDSLGHDLEATDDIFLARETDKKPSDNRLFSFRIINSDFNKDGYVKVEIGTALPVMYAEVKASCNYETIFSHELEISSRQVIKIPIVKNPETTMTIQLDFIWQNQLFSNTLNAFIPRQQENLQIEVHTLNSKLVPGSSQTWMFSIKGSRSQSEVLASMYDASLDRFTHHDWNYFNTYSYPQGYSGSKSLCTIGLSNGNFKRTIPDLKNPFGTADRFYTYGFILFNPTETYFYVPKQQSRNNKAFAITGTVNDTDGMPIAGAHVYLRGIMEGTVTDIDGVYTLYASPGDEAVFEYIGTQSQTIKITGSAPLNIIMSGQETRLDGVVIEGYRNTTRALSNVASTTVTSKTIEGRPNASFIQTLQGQVPGLNIESGSGQPGANSTVILRGYGSINESTNPLFVIDGVPLAEKDSAKLREDDIFSLDVLKKEEAKKLYNGSGSDRTVIVITTKAGMAALQNIKARKDLKETAFFYPNLTTDKKGNVSFTFTTPEALTEWKLRLLAHNKNAASAYFEKSFFTQKDLMVVPNMPRFLREKDTVVIFAKVTNLTAEPKTGNALLQLYDAMTMKAIDAQMLNTDSMKPFTIPAKGSTTVSWTIAVPEGLQGVQYKVLAKAGDFTDGEENILPVLPNSMLVTESIPVWVKPNSTKEYTFENLKNNTSTTLRHQGITLEYTSNPAWMALQSLPYLMEFEHECAEQVFSRYYANSIAAHILKSNPKIEELFASWRKEGAPASKLEQNEELKSIILAETPWMLDAQSEDEKKNRMAVLFEFDKMKDALDANFKKLEEKQMPSGAFPWFAGGNESEYITRHILAGFGHLEKLGVKPADSTKIKLLTKKALAFMDTKFLEGYKWAENYRKEKKSRNLMSVDATALHYLYARSFYLKSHPLNDVLKKAVAPYIDYVKLNWLHYGLYEKGMAALTLNRFGETAVAKKIINSLRGTSANNDEWGMYWIDNKAGWYWYRAPIETQALLIEAFIEVDNDILSADAMKVWLIKQKQNKNWPTTKSTSEAVYALLMQGSDWLSVKENTTITLGDSKLLEQKIADSGKEAGTGYIKLQWKPEEVTKNMATLKIENKSAVPGYGGFYWQYFEDLDKIKPAQEGIMNISKELYLKTNTAEGPQLKRITTANPLKIGDLVTMRLVLSIKEDVEYVHLKDLRAAAFEPVDVLSGYHWKDGLGYYQSTRDAATHFFFDSIKKGTYVLEYDVRVNNAGEYSNGITTIQSMYAPEFSGHTKGIRVKAAE